MLLGDGVIANMVLKDSKGNNLGLILLL